MIYRFITAIFISVIVSSCIVSKKKFDDMLAQKVKAEGELADKRKALDLANANISQLNESLKKNKKEADSLNESLHASNKKLADLNKDYEKLNANYKLSLTKSGKLNQDLSQQRDQLLTIQYNLEKTRQQND